MTVTALPPQPAERRRASDEPDRAAPRAYGGRWWLALRELALVLAGFQLYRWARLVTEDDMSSALDNAAWVLHLQAVLGLPSELTLQALTLRSDGLVELANTYYAAVHFPSVVALLVWLFLRRREHYGWVRNVLFALTLSALAVHLLVPLAPPRMMPGFVDTGLEFGQSVYTGSAGEAANQIAAMPSLHVGWAVLVAVVLVALLRSRRRWLVLLHPVLTFTVVVVTGNHYWLDGLIAIGLLVGALALLAPGPLRRLPWLALDGTSRPAEAGDGATARVLVRS